VIRRVVWHATAGAYAPSVSWLRNPAADASAHLVIREDGDEVTQLVKLSIKAWHAVAANTDSIGVEHASLNRGFAGSAQMRQSARVFGWICTHYGIPPLDATHRPSGIVRHRSLGVAGGGHSDGPSDSTWSQFLTMVHAEIVRGGYRKEWARL
jgi:N-acetyl-anhydromuramyl-L-alanine amidase AmpD